MFSVIIFRLGAGPRLASAVGKDEQGRGLLSGEELDTSLVRNWECEQENNILRRSGSLPTRGQRLTLLFWTPRASASWASGTWTSTHKSARIM